MDHENGVGGGMDKVEWRLQPVGLDVLSMTRDFPRWVSRREERIRFVNHEITERTIRVDLDLSAYRTDERNILDLADYSGRVMVPLAVISRSQHTTFSLVNEAGESLPRMTADEERFIVYAGLAYLVEKELWDHDQMMSPESRQVVWDIVHRPPSSAPLPSNPQLELARSNTIIASMLDEAASSHYLLVPLDPARGDRRVITYSYLEPARSKEGDASTDDAAGARKPGELLYSTPIRTAGDCRSYHFELSAPPALRVVDSTLEIKAAGDRNASLIQAEDDDRLTTHAHIHVSAVPPASSGEFLCRLALFPTGLVRVAMLSSVFSLVTVGLVALLVWLDGPLGFLTADLDASSGTAVLLLVAAFSGPLLAASDNHVLTTSLQLPVRFTMWAGGTGPFLAALAVASRVDTPVRVVLWSLSVLICVLATVFTYAQWRRLRS